jgi:hypothetical protein
VDYSRELGEAIVGYIPEIDKLADMPGGLKLACDLIIHLSSRSYSREFQGDQPYERIVRRGRQRSASPDPRHSDRVADASLARFLEDK